MIDASIVLTWFFEDERGDYEEAVLRRLEAESAVVPSIWPFEIANGLLVAARRGRVPWDEFPQVHDVLSGLPIAIRQPSLNEALTSVLSAARQHNLSAYDASYLMLASDEGLPLATRDTGLLRAAESAGVTLA